MPTDNPTPTWRRPSRWFSRFRRSPDIVTMSGDQDRELVLSLSPKRIPSWRQLSFLPRLLNRLEKRWLRSLATVASLSLLVLIAHQLVVHVEFIPADGGTLTEGLVGTPQYINPVLARPFTADTDLTQLLFRGLISFDHDLQPQNDLAQSITVSSDGKTYTAVLKPNQHWSDGSIITVDDIVYTYETVANSAYQSPRQSTYANVKVEATDERTVTFTLPSATPSFMAALSLGILPSQLWLDQTPQTFSLAELNVKPTGSGAMKFQSVTKDRTGNIRSYTFVRNKNFDGTATHLDKLIVKLYADNASALEALRSDAVDSLGGLSTADVGTVKKSIRVDSMPINQVTGVFFNTTKNAAMKSLDVRKALAMAVHRDDLIDDGLHGYGQPIYGPLIPGVPGYDSNAKKVDENTDAANAALDQAGWKRGEDGLRVKDKQPLAFALTTVDDPTYTDVATRLTDTWKSLGANVTLNIVATSDIQRNVITNRQFDALLFGQIIDAGGDLFPLWHSSQQSTGIALAVMTLKNADTDLEKARSATDEDARAAALKDFQNIIVDQVPAILLVQNEYLYAHRSNLRGIGQAYIISAEQHWEGIAGWYLKTHWHWK